MTTPQDGPIATETVDESIAEMFPDTGGKGIVESPGEPETPPTSETAVVADTPEASAPAASTPALPSTPSPSETDILRQQLAAKNEQIRIAEERHQAQQIDDRVRKYEYSLIQQNYTPEQAQQASVRERQYLDLMAAQKRESDASMDNYRLRVDTAMKVSKQHGVNYEDVLKFDSEEAMQAYASQGSEMSTMKRQIADLQKAAGPAPQKVDRGTTTPSSLTSRSARMQTLMDKAALTDAEHRELGDLTGN